MIYKVWVCLEAEYDDIEADSEEEAFLIASDAGASEGGRQMNAADERSRKSHWTARGRAEVSHPRYGAVTVPCGSPYEALLNACEVWGVDSTDVMRERKYTVLAARKGAKVTVAREYMT